jgi:LPXTG-motif cell wall-anchored protein
VFTLVVTAEPELPAAGLFGLALAGALSGLAGMVLTRKRRG